MLQGEKCCTTDGTGICMMVFESLILHKGRQGKAGGKEGLKLVNVGSLLVNAHIFVSRVREGFGFCFLGFFDFHLICVYA
jgi:hypothetical protein